MDYDASPRRTGRKWDRRMISWGALLKYVIIVLDELTVSL